MKITEIRIHLMGEDRLKAFASVTFDGSFVVRNMKVVAGTKGTFLCMPSRKLPDGTHKDMVHPINQEFREYLEKNVLQAYVPAIPGKESRKAEPGKEGLLGVEGVPDELILQGLQTALESSATGRKETAQTRPITYTDLYDWGVSGTANSAETRRRLLRRLGLPPRLSKKELLQVLNTLYTYDSLNAEIEKL